MDTSVLRSTLLGFAFLLFAFNPEVRHTFARQEPSAPHEQGSAPESSAEVAMIVYYLEIVTPDADATCKALEKLHGVRFGDPEPDLGNARTASLKGGGRLGVRAPMRETEQPVVRPYMLVDDIEAAVETAKAAGAEIALPPTEIPDRGAFAIYIQGGIQHGLWQR